MFSTELAPSSTLCPVPLRPLQRLDMLASQNSPRRAPLSPSLDLLSRSGSEMVRSSKHAVTIGY